MGHTPNDDRCPVGGICPASARLAGSDQRAYDEVVCSFIGAWENVLRLADSLYGWKAAERRSPSEHWTSLRMSHAFLERHLRNTAFFMISAVWNEDPTGADRYRDGFLRWLDTLRPNTETDYWLNHHALLIPDVLSLEWSSIERRLASYRRNLFIPQTVRPDVIFGLIIRNSFDDFVVVSAIITLAWYMNNQQSSDIGARMAALLLQRQVIKDEGSHFAAGRPRQGTFRLLFTLIIRVASSGTEYGASVDSLVQFLNGMSERRMVPGRVYSSGGWRGLDGVRLHFLAIMAAHIPSNDDGGVLSWVREIAANEDLFSKGDTSLRRISLSLEASKQDHVF